MIKGWCPNLFTPMQSGDGWLVRLPPRRAMLSAAEARVVADAAGRHGSGVIGLTNRGNLQIRGLTSASAHSFAEAMVAAGIASGQAGHNLLVSPLAGADPGVHPQTTEIAGALDAALAGAGDLAELPDKFLFVVDGGGAAGLRTVRADIAVRAVGEQWAIWIDGEPLGAACDADAVADAVPRIARGFVRRSEGLRRMRQLVRSGGSLALFQASDLVATIPSDFRGVPDWIGFRALAGETGGFGMGVPFGQVNSKDLRDLAALSEQFGDGTLRITPWRSVILTGVPIGGAAALGNAAKGWISDPSDPRRLIFACPGRPGCASGTVPARADAEWLAAIALTSAVHVSGCAKGCAHPAAAPRTLVGRDGTYSLVRNGRARDAPDATGLTLAEAAKLLMEP